MPPDDLDNDTLLTATCNAQLEGGMLACDRWHHFYHYQSSAQYLWLGVALRLLGREEDALNALRRALFQDHLNEEAKARIANHGPQKRAPAYHKHPLGDLAFRASIGEPADGAARHHEEAVQAYLAEDYDTALACIARAVESDPVHSNSYFLRGKCRFAQGDCENARADFAEAVRLSHLKHEEYHRLASREHLARGHAFMTAGERDLAINDFTKALDLFPRNKEALQARAQAYRMKGSMALAEEDEKRLLSNRTS